MSERIDKQQLTVEDVLAARVEDRRGRGSPWAEALRELGAVDRAVYEAVAVTPTPHLDDALRQLSKAANYSRLWLGMGAAIATVGGRRGRRVALEGVLAIGATSATVNLGISVGQAGARRAQPSALSPPGVGGTHEGLRIVGCECFGRFAPHPEALVIVEQAPPARRS